MAKIMEEGDETLVPNKCGVTPPQRGGDEISYLQGVLTTRIC